MIQIQRPKQFEKAAARLRKEPQSIRRHVFTQAERSRGFWTAVSIWGVSMGAKLNAAGRWPGYHRG